MNSLKKEKKQAAIKLLKYIIFGGIGCLIWTFTMILTIIITTDTNTGVELFVIINSWLYKLYATLVGISIFIYLIEYIFKKRRDNIPEIVVKDPRDHGKKQKYRYKPE